MAKRSAPILALLVLAFAFPAYANICAPRAKMLDALAKRYHETPAYAGLSGQGHMIEIIISENDATWSMIATTPDGTTCIINAGKNWEARQTKKGAPL